MGVPYREAEESSDREGIALQDLGQRRTRLRTRILFVFLIAGAALGVPGYVVMREIQFALAGFAFFRLSAVGFAAPIFATGAVGLAVARRVVRARTGAWLDELARQYQVKRERLAEVTELVDAAEGG